MTPAKEKAARYLTIYRNLPWTYTLAWLDSADRRINLTGWGAKLVVKESLEDDAVVLHTFTTADGSIVLGNGTIEFKIPLAATTTAFTWREGVGHLVLQAPAGQPTVQSLFVLVVQNSTTDTPVP